jgi:hypothetical protein
MLLYRFIKSAVKLTALSPRVKNDPAFLPEVGKTHFMYAQMLYSDLNPTSSFS